MKLTIKMLMAAAASTAFASGCSQPAPTCLVGRADTSDYSVRYTLKSGDGCGVTAEALAPVTLSVQKYSGAAQSGQRDIAIRPSSFYDAENKAPFDGTTIATGALTSENPIAEGSQEYCSAPTLAPISTTRGGASTETWTFTKVKFLETAQFPGTQVRADIAVSIDACKSTYEAVGVWPIVNCSTHNLDTGDANGIDDRLCDSNFITKNPNDPQVLFNSLNATFDGRNINSGFKLVCSPTTSACIAASDFPSIR